MRNFLILIMILIILVLIILIKSKYEISRYEIKKEIIKSSKVNSNVKIVFLSDLHEKVYGDNNEKIINDIFSCDSEYIVIGGDLIINSKSKLNNKYLKIDNTIDFLTKIKNKNKDYNKKIYYAFGNHELRLKYSENEEKRKIFDKLLDHIKNCNINIIDDEYFDLDSNIRLYAISIFKGFYNKSFIFNKKNNLLTNDIIKEHLGEIDENKLNIVLSHSPDYADNLLKYGFDMVLSGHYHGGLIRLPILGALFSPDLMLFPKYSFGLYENNGKYVYVTNGLGEHFINIRFLNVPSFVELEIIYGK